jgi:hypothetical protein
MTLLVHTALDIFEQKQKLSPSANTKSLPPYMQSTYLGMMMETFISSYELDMYGYIS